MVTTRPVVVDARSYFRLGIPTRIASTLRIGLSEHCFVPSLDDLDADWLASVAVPAVFDLATAASHAGRLLTYGWKKQAGPEESIPGYVAMEREGLGPFHFYRVADVSAAFAGLDPEQAGSEALAIEADLAAKRLTAGEALALRRSGSEIAHTVVALLSEPA
jgi:hypothetical protein